MLSSLTASQSLSFVLKDKTALEHRKTEASPLMVDILGDGFTHGKYSLILERFISFYRPLELSLKSFISNSAIDYNYLAKLPLLENDLKFITKNESLNISDAAIPKIDTEEAVLGVLYVIEGSTMGGMMIQKILQKHMDTNQGATFFNPYNELTRKNGKLQSYLLIVIILKIY